MFMSAGVLNHVCYYCLDSEPPIYLKKENQKEYSQISTALFADFELSLLSPRAIRACITRETNKNTRIEEEKW